MLSASTVAAFALAGVGLLAALAGALLFRLLLSLRPRGGLPEVPQSEGGLQMEVARLSGELKLMEDRFDHLRSWVADEVANAKTHSSRARAALSSARKIARQSAGESEADDDVRGDDEGGSSPQGVLPLRDHVGPAPAREAVADRFNVLREQTIRHALTGLR